MSNTESFETNSISGQIVLLGHHKRWIGESLPICPRIDPSFSQDDRNLPAVVFEVSENGESKGTYLASCSSEFVQTVQGKRMRENDSSPKTSLSEFQYDAGEFEVGKYPGTQIPHNFESRVVVEDDQDSRMENIWMNHPLRKNGQTFYQYQMNENQLAIQCKPFFRWCGILTGLPLTSAA